jgi:hypothetical protein
MGFRDAKRQCQDVLQTKDRQGLPLAGPSPQKDGNARVWVQLSLWDEGISLYNMALRIDGIAKDHDTLLCLWRYHIERFGTAPPIPSLTFPDHEEMWWYRILGMQDDGEPDEEEEDEA